MTDQHREPAETSSTTKGRLRPVLWLVLAVSAALNALVSFTDINVLVGVALGLVALASAGALIAGHFRNRA
jgi:hypothetical protein